MDAIREGAGAPLMVGSFLDKGQRRFLPASWNELERSRVAAASWLRSFGFPRGSHIISSFTNMDNVQATPFDRGAASIGLIPCSAEVQPNEAGRFEMIIRRFQVAGVAVASDGVLAELEKRGFAFATLFTDCVMWLRPPAYERYRDTPGVHVRRWLDLGPAISFECVAGEGAHVDAREWEMEEKDGEILLTSRLSRSLHFRRWQSGVKGILVHGRCKCGSMDPRVIPDA